MQRLYSAAMRLLLACCLFLMATALARADEAAAVPAWLSEVKGGILTHNSEMLSRGEPFHFWKEDIEHGLDANLEILFNGPSWLSYIGAPRLQLGGDLSLTGATDHIYAGPYWDYTFDNGVFIGGALGLALHDGTVDLSPVDPATGTVTDASAERYNHTKKFGSRLMFHLGPEVGYRFDAHNSLMLTWYHFSNGYIFSGLDGPNPGQDNIGLRYGYTF